VARKNPWSPSIAGLLTAVAALAVSFGSLRLFWEFGRPPMEARTYDCFTASATFLAPTAWASTALAMSRTPRKRWAAHPAVVVGLSAATVLLLQVALSPLKFDGAWDWLSVEFVVESWQEGVAEVLVAAFVVAVACGRLRRPGDGLEAMGVALGLLWVAAAAGLHLINLLG